MTDVSVQFLLFFIKIDLSFYLLIQIIHNKVEVVVFKNQNNDLKNTSALHRA